MKTKYIFQTLALAMLLPVMLLATACSNINDDEIIDKNGYTLPVTVNVTRQGDESTTKATYNTSTYKLEFSTGDQLFVQGNDEREGGAGQFAGTLTWNSGGTFSGTITTENLYSGTFDNLFTNGGTKAALLPAGYDNHRYLSISNSTYTAHITLSASNAFVTSTAEKTAKALAVEQFSMEMGTYSSGTGFALNPFNAILNFTITGLTPSTNVTATLAKESSNLVTGSVTTDGSGQAIFAMAVTGGYYLNKFTLTVGGNAITLTSSDKKLEAGKIYNINRSALTYPIAISAVTSAYVGSVVTTDGNVYPPKTAVPTGKTAVGILGKVTGTGHGLILALQDATSQVKNTISRWESVTAYAGTTLKLLPDDSARGGLTSYTALGATTVSNWAVAQKSDYEDIFTNLGSTTGDHDGRTFDDNVNAYITTGVGGVAFSDREWWSATEGELERRWCFKQVFWWWYSKGNEDKSCNIRPVLGF